MTTNSKGNPDEEFLISLYSGQPDWSLLLQFDAAHTNRVIKSLLNSLDHATKSRDRWKITCERLYGHGEGENNES